jgi:uncharacterized DUF497 family protein
MKFEWDSAKNIANIRKHNIDFNDAIAIFKHTVISSIDTRDNYGEERWISIGHMQCLTIVIVYVEYVNDIIRIISARKATKREKQYYEETCFK